MTRALTVKQTYNTIRALGLSVRRIDGEWRINYRGGREATSYYTNDNEDAVHTAHAFLAQRTQQ